MIDIRAVTFNGGRVLRMVKGEYEIQNWGGTEGRVFALAIDVDRRCVCIPESADPYDPEWRGACFVAWAAEVQRRRSGNG